MWTGHRKQRAAQTEKSKAGKRKDPPEDDVEYEEGQEPSEPSREDENASKEANDDQNQTPPVKQKLEGAAASAAPPAAVARQAMTNQFFASQLASQPSESPRSRSKPASQPSESPRSRRPQQPSLQPKILRKSRSQAQAT